jgi:hypothetical protein
MKNVTATKNLSEAAETKQIGNGVKRAKYDEGPRSVAFAQLSYEY